MYENTERSRKSPERSPVEQKVHNNISTRQASDERGSLCLINLICSKKMEMSMAVHVFLAGFLPCSGLAVSSWGFLYN
jgi:hypothetical protein